MKPVLSAFLVARRLGQVFWSLGRFLLLPSLMGKLSTNPAERLRQGLEHLGGAWIKIGQGLALRFDLLPAEYCDELLKLLSDMPPFPYTVVRETMKKELGRFPEEIFTTFEVKPFAAASIAQVHKATIHNKRFAVKVQRPSLSDQFAADFKVMRLLSYVLDLAKVFGGISVRTFVDEFEQWVKQEMDFRTEARNGYRMALFSKDDPLQVAAKVQFEYTTERILTTEYLDGIPLLQITNAIRNSDTAYLKDLAYRGYDVAKIARHIYWNFANQVFRDRFFHADTHPANLVIFPGNVIGYMDFGIMGSLPKSVQESLQAYVHSIFQNNFDAAVTESFRWMTAPSTTNLDRVREDFICLLENYRYGSPNERGQSYPHQVTSSYIIEMMSVARIHRLSISQDLILYFKAALTTDAVVFQLAPQFDLFRDVNKFFALSFATDIARTLNSNRIAEAVFEFSHETAQLINDIDKVQSTGHAFQVWLQTLQTRVVLYGIAAIGLGIGAYLVYLKGYIEGIGQYLLPGGLLFAAAVCLRMILRQGEELSAIERSPVTGRSTFDRSLGRISMME
jgi:predicted unusual protein kinase regulating ubiquinone biosynthesis (AarF/ABC1/UbiB family)